MFHQQLFDCLDRNVPIHDVVADERRMAALKLSRDARLPADLAQIGSSLYRHREAVVPEIVGIALAAAALRVFVKLRRNRLGIGRAGQRHGRCGNQQGSSCQHRLPPYWAQEMRKIAIIPLS